MTTATWTKEIIREKLNTSDQWVIRGTLAIYAKQTAEEQNSDATLENNGVGFNGVDAELMSSYAIQYNRKGFLTPNQIAWARKKILKYSGQLAKIANGAI